MEKLKNHLGLSRITLGTMRFFDKDLSQKQVLNLIEESWESGITSHHTSSEYSSYELYTKALNKTSLKGKIKHIVKISSPHFEDSDFSSKILEDRIDNQLKSLGSECIDVLQWLVRSKPINDYDRLQLLKDKKAEINSTLSRLKQKGKIKTTFSFPYSVTFAQEVIKLKEVDGIISYLNAAEKEYVPFANNVPFIAIRPLFAGKLLKEAIDLSSCIKEQINFVEKHKNVLTTIVGINKVSQIKTYSTFLK